MERMRCRGYSESVRLAVGMVAAIGIGVWYWSADPDGGLQVVEQLRTLAGLIAVTPVVYLLRRLITGGRSQSAFDRAMETSIGAGIAFLGLCLLAGMLFLAANTKALAAESALPGMAARDLPVLAAEIDARWPSMPARSMLAALVEQESRWKPTARLKTSREEGAGYGQFTRAYRADGSLRFDALAEVIRLDASLSDWSWEDRYNPRMQLRAVTIKVRDCYGHLQRLAADSENALAMCDGAYNGGLGGLYAERRLCAAAQGCDAGKWFGHVEAHSNKSRVKWRGYGASAYDINRQHVRNVMVVRRPKYVPLLGS